MNALLPLLLIASILTCPIRCAAGSLISALPTETKSFAPCCCCHAQADVLPVRNQSDFPDKGCECENCFCGGVIVESNSNLFVTHWLVGFVDWPTRSDLRAVSPSVEALNSNIAAGCRCYACGRDARIAYRSLLI